MLISQEVSQADVSGLWCAWRRDMPPVLWYVSINMEGLINHLWMQMIIVDQFKNAHYNWTAFSPDFSLTVCHLSKLLCAKSFATNQWTINSCEKLTDIVSIKQPLTCHSLFMEACVFPPDWKLEPKDDSKWIFFPSDVPAVKKGAVNTRRWEM